MLSAPAHAADKWVTSWAASVQGPYPVGNPSAQPVQKFAFPAPEAGARDQTFRLIVMPDVWGKQARLRFSNALGTKPVTFDGVFVGLQLGSATVAPGTNRPVTFGGKPSVTIEPGKDVWSDGVALPFVKDAKALAGRKLAVSFHVAGETGPMTWHAKALQTSYVTAPGAGAKGRPRTSRRFRSRTASWFFLDAVDMMAPRRHESDRRVRRLDHRRHRLDHERRRPLAERAVAPARRRRPPRRGGQCRHRRQPGGRVRRNIRRRSRSPAGRRPMSRIERDVLTLSGVTAMIWLEGINDFSKNGNATAQAVQDAHEGGRRDACARKSPASASIGATAPTALNATNATHGFAEQNDKRKALNEFIRTSGVFDGVVDFDKATLDPATGELKAEFVPESTTGGPGDKLHPNRAGYLAMGNSIDLDMLMGKKKDARASRRRNS